MNLRRIFLIAILLLTLGIGTYAQESPKAVLVDAHLNVPCDESLARIDNFHNELEENPNSMGLVAISNSPEKRLDGVYRQVMIERHMKARGSDLDRVKFVRSIDAGELKIRFWLIPPGAVEPQIDLDDSFEIPSSVGPFLFGWEYSFGDQICPEIDDGEIFGQFLKANPESRANLVFRDRSMRRARKRANQAVAKLTRRYGISRQRIRIFFVKPEPRLDGDEPITEFWYLP